MNQILCKSSIHMDLVSEKYLKIKIFKCLFYVLLIISAILSIYYIYFRYDLYRTEKLSKKILNDYNITSIYNFDTENSFNQFSNNSLINNSFDVSSHVIGILEIRKINIKYPILSDIDANFLKLSPCKFCGPMPNEIGNLCIAAHNYKNGTFFSNLSNLNNGDIITIYDIAGGMKNYVVYKTYTTSANDIDCINQNTNNKRFVTLITCDNVDNHFRTIVKAKEY